MFHLKKGLLFVIPQFLLLLMIAFASSSTHRTVLGKALGSILFFVGMAIITFAWIALRPALTALPEPKEDAPFITHGIYRYVRHPMYLGLLTAALGVTYIKWSRDGAIATVLLFILLRLKMRYEDRLLRDRWPEAAEYQSKVGALLPRSQA